MYLPQNMPQAKVLVTVKTYPQPSRKYEEVVCTAGILENGKWVRIYPIPFRSKAYDEQYKKYSWIELDLVRRKDKDFRPESYRPKQGIDEQIRPVGRIDTSKGWQDRKSLVLKEVFTSMEELISRAKGEERKSLATLKPVEIIDLVIEETGREWKKETLDQLNQMSLFELDERGQGKKRQVVSKLPYKYSYLFLSEGDRKPRKLMIEDWEIGALYWHCLAQTEGNEIEANRLVHEKYFERFAAEKDLYLFLGTTLQNHIRGPNPFIIIGVFYPPKVEYEQLSLL